MPAPLVTIIVLHWRNYAATRRCLTHLHTLDYPNAHILVADNGSHDGLFWRLAQEFPAIETLEYATNRGFAAGVNPAIRRAREQGSAAVWLVNNDVSLSPDTLSRLVARQQQHPRVGVLAPQQCFTQRPTVPAGYGVRMRRYDIDLVGWERPAPPPPSLPVVPLDAVFASAMLIDCRVFAAIGLFDERYFFYYEDIDFCLRAGRAGFQVGYAPDIEVQHEYAASVSRVTGLREYHLARNRQVFFRTRHRNLHRLWYTLHELPHLLRYLLSTLRTRTPADALGYLSGALLGLLLPLPAVVSSGEPPR
ncbi:MAG: glycosyltransferase family 2 protein [Chloroflexaceae bacterium]|nr:glycosyltransferase family 2 protein [Chloroflexaceae bacterium]